MINSHTIKGVVIIYDGAIAHVYEGEIEHGQGSSGGHEFLVWGWRRHAREDSSFRYKVALAMPKSGARDHCCPFCASVDIITTNQIPLSGAWWVVHCQNCAAEGPRAPTEDEALRRWDSIVNRQNGQ